MNWIVIRTALSKEQWVARAIAREGFEASVPMDVRSYRPSPHSKRRKVYETPLIPKIVFAQIPAFEENLMANVKYVLGLHRDSLGAVSTIPPSQMARFHESHSAWLERARKAHSIGQPGKVKKPKWRSLDALKEFFDPETGEILEKVA